MATTAYSRHYAREIDVEQLAGLLRGTQPISAEQASDIDPKFSEWIRSDIRPAAGSVLKLCVRPGRAERKN